MEIYKLLGLCLCALFILNILQQYAPSFWSAAAIACGMVLLASILHLLDPVLAFVQSIAQLAGEEYVGVVFKACSIALLAQSVQDSCAQAGQTALAGYVELAGKAGVLLAALPLLRILTDALSSLLG